MEIRTDKILMFPGDDLAKSVWKSKYEADGETHYDQMHKRMAKEFYRIDKGYQDKEFTNQKALLSKYGIIRKALTEDDIFDLFKDFGYVVPQGSVMSGLGTKNIVSLSNCVVLDSPMDSYNGILYKDFQLTALYRRRNGVGFDISNLRPNGTFVNNSAKTSTGAVSFAERFSNTTREVAMNGRRGALMLSMDIRHPDILEFIKCKQDLTKVTGANISVRLNDEFMEAVEKDKDYILRFPCENPVTTDWVVNGETYKLTVPSSLEYNKLYDYESVEEGKVYIKKVRAKDIWNELAKSAHNTAEPGILFWDNMIGYSPDGVYDKYRAISTNPSLRKGTRILTEKGIFPIEELEDKTFKVLNSNNEYKTAKCFLSGKNKPLYEILLKGGHKYFATAEHKWLVDDKKVCTKDLKEGMYLPMTKKEKLNYGYLGDELDGFFIGWLYGDGWYTVRSDNNKIQIGMVVGVDDQTPEIIDKLNRFLGKFSENINFNTRDNNTIEFNSTNIALINYLEKFKIGKKDDGFPLVIWDIASEEFRKGFLDGLISSDGHKTKTGGLHLVTSREKIAIDFKELLGFYGIKTSYRHSISTSSFPNKKDYKRTYDRYDVQIDDSESINHLVEFFNITNTRKQLSLRDIRNDYRLKYTNLIRIESVKETEFKEDVWDITVYDNTHTFNLAHSITGNCSEIGMSNDSCRLMAMNLFSFVDNKFTDEASFNYELFYRKTYEAMRQMDNLVDLEIEAIDKILAKIESDPEPDYVKTIEIDTWKKLRQMGLDGRRTGLGFTALADTLAALGLKYGSDEFLKEVDQIMNYKMRAELDATIDLAILRGTFEGWDTDEEFINVNEVWSGTNDWYDFVFKEFPEQAAKMIAHGRRNVSFSTIAPTGSLSLLTQTTSGIEPLFQPWYTRRKKINPNEQGTRVDYVDDMGDSWTEYFVLHPKFKEWLYLQHNSLSIPRLGITGSELVPPEQWEKEILEEAFKYSPWYGSCANDIDWKKRIEVQAICQKYTTHSISSTINLPKDVSVETVSNIYFSAWEQGLKGLTVYRDGSRSGVLVTEPSTPKFQHIKAPKRPKKVEGEATLTKAKGEDYTVFVGFMDGKPYEVFAYKGNGITGVGKIVKKAQGHYVFVQEDIEFEITDNLTDEQEAITRGYSWGLRHGGGIEFAVEQLNKTKGSLVGFNKSLARVLKKYIPKDAVISDKLCPACGEEGLVYEESCLQCKNCGYGKC